MKFGIVLLHHPYNEQRIEWSARSFNSLAKTHVLEDHDPLCFVVSPGGPDFRACSMGFPWATYRVGQPLEAPGCDGALCWGLDEMVKRFADVTHLIVLTDDYVYNPEWLCELQALIIRRPGARAWWVLRAGHYRHHWPIREDGDDVLVHCIDGDGCFTREEYLEWAPDYHAGSFHIPTPDGGNTLDLYHCYKRPGEYWVTKRSYIQNIGVEGVHNSAGVPREIDFIGE